MPPIGCTVSLEASISGSVAVTRTSTPSRRTAFATCAISVDDSALAATKTHSAPDPRISSRRSSMPPTTGVRCAGGDCSVATRPIERNPNRGCCIAVSRCIASTFVPTIRVGKRNRPWVRERNTHQCQTRRVARANSTPSVHDRASQDRDSDAIDHTDSVTSPITPTVTARMMRRNSSAGVNRWAWYSPNAV